MIALIQRVKKAAVSVDGETVGKISCGLLILLGVVEGDTEKDLEWLVKKCSMMRIFPDENGVMNRSVIDAGGEVLSISQFTLAADIKKGNRPSYIKAMRPENAILFYDRFCTMMSEAIGKKVEKGVFGADMDVELTNWGPVTIIADSSLMRNA